MEILAALAVLVVVAVALGRFLGRANDLFVLDVRDGRVVVVRGRIPQRLLDDVADVVRRPAIRRARIRVRSSDGWPALDVRGEVSEAQAQRLRNVVGTWKVAALRAAPSARKS